MADKQAVISVALEGDEIVVSKLEKIGDTASGAATKSAKSWEKFSSSIGGAVASSIQDLTRLATVAQGISLSQAIDSARKYQDQVARMSVFTGTAVGDLTKKYSELSKSKLVPVEQVANFQKQLGHLTYDTKGATDAFSGLADESYATGKPAWPKPGWA